jgi:hypothetical protein
MAWKYNTRNKILEIFHLLSELGSREHTVAKKTSGHVTHHIAPHGGDKNSLRNDKR